MEIKIQSQILQLDSRKAIWWEEQQTLITADLHLGKVKHFRENGLPVPSSLGRKNFVVLEELINAYPVKRMLFLGDLFHSIYNDIWQKFSSFRKKYPSIEFVLVQGNHDILAADQYDEAGIKVVQEPYIESDFLFSHHPQKEIPAHLYNLYGHIHPGVTLYGVGKQVLKLPCFYFGEKSGILPAFGSFTGTARLEVKKGDHVFVIAESELIAIPT